MAVVFAGVTGDMVKLDDRDALTLPNGNWFAGGWIKHGTAQRNFPYLLSYGNFGATASLSFYIATSNDTLNVSWKDDSANSVSGEGSASDLPQDDTWRYVCVYYDGTNVKVRVDGSDKITAAFTVGDVTNATDNSGILAIGTRSDGGSNRTMDADFAEWAKWDRKPTEAEILALEAGAAPTLFPKDLKWYVPLIRNMRDECNAEAVTLTGGSVTAHPRIVYPSAQILQFPPSAAPPAGARPQGPFGHPFKGAFGGPI